MTPTVAISGPVSKFLSPLVSPSNPARLKTSVKTKRTEELFKSLTSAVAGNNQNNLTPRSYPDFLKRERERDRERVRERVRERETETRKTITL